MQHNVGGIDRTVRIIAGVAIIAAGLYFKSWWGVIGIAPLLTGTLRWCPAYLPFGIKSR
jgi:sulfite exporter TauE/SafE